MDKITHRLVYGLCFLVCLGLFCIALYFQFVEGLEPCPLCVLQRIFVILLGLVMLMAFLHNPVHWGQKVYGILIGLVALGGASVSTRQVYLQLFPSEHITTCGAGLTYMISTLPLDETMRLVFQGSGECDRVQWSFLGLSMAGWLLLFFIGFAIIAFWQAFRKVRVKTN